MKLIDAAQLERQIIESGLIHENRLLMYDALRHHFDLAEVRELSLLHLCELYRMVIEQDRATSTAWQG